MNNNPFNREHQFDASLPEFIDKYNGLPASVRKSISSASHDFALKHSLKNGMSKSKFLKVLNRNGYTYNNETNLIERIKFNECAVISRVYNFFIKTPNDEYSEYLIKQLINDINIKDMILSYLVTKNGIFIISSDREFKSTLKESYSIDRITPNEL